MSSIIANSNENGEQEIFLKGSGSEEFCLNGWNYHDDYEGIYISFYWGEEKKEISHRFDNNDSFNTHTIDLEQEVYSF